MSKKQDKNITIFIDEIYSKPPKKYYETNKTIVKHINDLFESIDILDMIRLWY